MNHGVRRVIEYAKESGVSMQELMSTMLEEDISYVYDFITKKLAICVQKEVSAELAYEDLLKVVSEEQLYNYIEAQKFVDAIMSSDGLNVYNEVDFLIEIKEFVRLELKNRGVKEVSYVWNRDSGVLTIQVAECAMEMEAWDDAYCEHRSEFYESFYEGIIEEMLSSDCEVLLDEISVEEEIDTALAYRDIRKVLSSKDTSSFSKHEFDIYFAFQAVIGNVIYYDDDIAVETVRLTEYWYGGHESILDTLENLRLDYVCIGDFSDCDSFGELLSELADWYMEDWDIYGEHLWWGTEDI